MSTKSFEQFFYKNIAKKIKKYRCYYGYTQERLSEILDLNLKYIGHIERCERKISTKVLIKIIYFFKISPNDFFDFDEKYDY